MNPLALWGLLKRVPWQLLVVVAIAVTLFFSGYHYGKLSGEVKLNEFQRAQDVALSAQKLEQAKRDEAYQLQLAAAAAERDNNRAELARIRGAPHPRQLRCYAEGSTGTMPGVPGSPDAGAAGGGELPQAFRFDPYAEADRADELVEQFRDFYNRWPH